jgi:hypothetical protein
VVIFKAHDTWYLFDRNDQKLIVFAFMAIFVSYFPLFWGFGGFTWPVTLGTCLRGMTKNSSFLCFRAVFMSYCPLFWVSEVIYKAHDTHYMFERHVPKLVIFAFMAIFVSYCPYFWGSGAIYMANDT